MASSYHNLFTVEQPWILMPEFLGCCWISDVFTKESDAITDALQSSFDGVAAADSSYNRDLSYSYVTSDELLESVFTKPDETAVQTPSASIGSANEIPAAVSKQRRRSAPPPGGRITKRKSRAKKKASTTTFIAADPANFRQMVQQVTGAKFAPNQDGHPPEASWKPEAGGLQTLDKSSAFLIDGPASLPVPRHSAEHYTDSYCNFPTLESSVVGTMLKP